MFPGHIRQVRKAYVGVQQTIVALYCSNISILASARHPTPRGNNQAFCATTPRSLTNPMNDEPKTPSSPDPRASPRRRHICQASTHHCQLPRCRAQRAAGRGCGQKCNDETGVFFGGDNSDWTDPSSSARSTNSCLVVQMEIGPNRQDAAICHRAVAVPRRTNWPARPPPAAHSAHAVLGQMCAIPTLASGSLFGWTGSVNVHGVHLTTALRLPDRSTFPSPCYSLAVFVG